MLPAVSLLAGPAVALVLALLLALMTRRYRVSRADALLLGGPFVLGAGAAVAAALGAVSDSGTYSLLVLLGFVVSYGVLRHLDRPRGRVTERLRRRFLFGVPWGTLVVVTIVLADYLVLQNGLHHPYDPVTIPFTSWSYLYPLGVLTAPFSHHGLGHITGNLIGTIVLAPIAEYAVGHYPRERGVATFSTLRTNPYARAFLLFPLGVVVVAEATSVFAWGPIIGFSGVVFAFLGFAITRYPIATVVGLVAQAAISDVYRALRDPVVVATAGPGYGGPWWAGIAVQGHLTGLLIGFLIGAVYKAHTRERPGALQLWGAVVAAGFSLPLWTIWWYRGPETFVLYRWLGVLLVLALGTLAATIVRATDRPLSLAAELDVTRRQAAILCVVVPLVVVAGVAVPVNLTSVASSEPSGGVHVHDYRVTYAENVPNQRVDVISLSVLGESTRVNASGVIVIAPDRHVWTQAISSGNLAYWGTRSVRVGGVGWTSSVAARRRGWSAAGGGTTYRVALRPPGGTWQPAFTSHAVRARPTVAGRNVTVAATESNFTLTVSRHNETLASGPLPVGNETVSLGGLHFTRQKERVVAAANGTRVTIATRETYH